MIADLPFAMPALAMTGLYAFIGLLLMALNLKRIWPWPVKASAIALTLPATVGTFLTVEAQIGWPSDASLPHAFQLHAVLVEEPSPGGQEKGVIFLWISPWGDAGSEGTLLETSNLRPRAFALPYSRELHKKIDAMRENLARGEMVTGRHDGRPGWERRFGEQSGTIDLAVPPAPPLPKKEGG